MSRKIEDENRKRTTGRRKIAAGSRRTNQVRQGIEVMNLDQKETERPRSSMRRSKKSGRNLEFLIITYLFLAIFIGMISYFIYFQMVKSESVINSSYNSRLDLYAEHVIRGDITTADGTVLAKTTVSDDGSETREYPYGRMFAHVVGYTNNGKGGLESQYNFNLLRSHSFFLTQIINDLKNKKNIGDTLVTTLDYDVQETAYKALGDRDGAVVVMEVKTGKILASQSTNVDTVSGATYSSVGIINAVRNALAQAAVNPGEGGQQDLIVPELPEQKVEDVPAVPTVSGNFPYPDGTYYGTAEGYLGDITVAVVIQNQTIQSVEILSNEDDAAYFDRAKVVANRVVNQQTIGVDTVSGATYSSRGIINAIQAALDAAKIAADPSQPVNPDHGNAGDNGNNGNDNNGNTDNGNDGSDTDKKSVYYADGTYPVTVLCEPDEDEDFEPYHLSANIVIKNDRVAEINNVTGDGDSGNNSYIKRAVNGTSGMTGMVSRMIGMAVTDMSGENAGAQVDQNLTELDTVSRATCTSKSIKEACREALRQAREKFLAETESARNEDGEDSAE